MKKILFVTIILALFVAPCFATTKTVGKSGASFTSIQAAIDSFTQAEVTDGTPDIVEIIDAGEYDEQVTIGGLIPDPDGLPEGYLDDAIDLAKKRDAFTLRGKDSSNRPKINPISEGVAYGVFTGDSGDNFVATFSFLGKDITVENVEILQSSVIADDQYGMNGQAGNMVFKNVLFAHAGNVMPGEAIVNINNDVSLCNHGIDNSYTFIDCTFDAAVNGERNDSVDTIYFHGYSQGDVDGAGLTIDDAATSFTFEGCKFLNSDIVSMIRGNAQANHLVFNNCYFEGNKHGLRGSGKGSLTIEDSIFHNNMQIGGDADTDTAVVETVERSSHTPQVTIRNSLFIKNMAADYASLNGSIGIEFKAAAILIRPGGTDPDVTIEKCTFVDNPIAIRFIDRNAGLFPRTAAINNNIFQHCNSSVLTADSAADSYFMSVAADVPVDVLTVNGVNNVFDGNNTIVEYAELLPNVTLNGSEAAVTFTNTTIDPSAPFAGPPYAVASGAPVGVGADLGSSTAIPDFMIYE